jgi:hypothetical protein
MTTKLITSGITEGQKKQFVRFVEDAASRALAEINPNKGGLQQLIENGGKFQSDLAALIARFVEPALSVPTYKNLCKEFDWVCDEFKKNEATDWQLDDSCMGVATADPEICELVQFGMDMSTEDLRNELKNRGLRPATLDELLAYARKYPDKQKEFPIVALGVSYIWDGCHDLPCLDWDGDGRGMSLDWGGSDWNSCYRFLAVRA